MNWPIGWALVALSHLVPAARFLPQLGWLHERHQQFNGAGLVHLFTHDRFDLADHPQAGRHVGIDPRTEALDHPGTHHQLVADDFRVGWRFFLSRYKKT